MCAAQAGADAIGLIFAPSPRQVTMAQARRIARALTPFVTRVGVMVNEPLDRLRALVDEVRLDAVQLHGDETFEYCEAARGLGVTTIKTVRVADALDLDALRRWAVDAILLDTYHPEQRGGTGRPFDWRLARAVCASVPVVLSGGLTPDNVAVAIATARPYAVDASSGLETDGRKDPAKIRAFVIAAREAAARRAEASR